jgi:hypothetical protein
VVGSRVEPTRFLTDLRLLRPPLERVYAILRLGLETPSAMDARARVLALLLQAE